MQREKKPLLELMRMQCEALSKMAFVPPQFNTMLGANTFPNGTPFGFFSMPSQQDPRLLAPQAARNNNAAASISTNQPNSSAPLSGPNKPQ